MNPQTPSMLVNWSPLAQLLLMGLAVATGPVVWVWLRSRHVPVTRRLQLLTLLTLFLTFDLVLFGAFTRLTDSGLGCPDWPGCYGHASPVGAVAQIAQAQAAMPTGPVTHNKAWVEMVHRYLATGVGVLILTLTAMAWKARLRRSVLAGDTDGSLSPWWPTLTLVWVCLQGAFGAFTVTWKLFPAIVTMHLLGGMVLLALLKAQSVRYSLQRGDYRALALTDGTQTLLGWCFALLWWQIALGGWVSTNYAVLVCDGFPTCQRVWWPAMDFQNGFTLWRSLGLDASGSSLTLPALTAIHMAHRLAALLVFASLAILAVRLYRVAALRAQARWLAALLALQLATGLSNVVLGWPLLGAVLHTGGAAGLVLLLTGLVVQTRTAHNTVSASKFSSSRLEAP